MSIKQFVIPTSIQQDDSLNYCLEIINKYRAELRPLRMQNSNFKRRYEIKDRKIEELKNQYKQEKDAHEELKKEYKKLQSKYKKLLKTKYRYQAALFDHGNFKNKSKNDDKNKKKGGQLGHPDTNKKIKRSEFKKKRIYLESCPYCKNALTRVKGIKKKILIDIVINPKLVQLIIESERQWCSDCKKEINARHQQSLPFTEYGLNTFLMIMILRYKGLLSLTKISTMMKIVYGLDIKEAAINNILKQAKKYLKKKYDYLVKQIRAGKIMYNDETGWFVKGKKAYIWIMANDDITIYKSSESRGSGVFSSMYWNSKAVSMHDGYAAYASVTDANKDMYCWAHVLRFAHEEVHNCKKNSEESLFCSQLINIYRMKEKYLKRDKKYKQALEFGLKKLIQLKTKSDSILNIQTRLKTQSKGLIRSLMLTKDGTNNLAERELRPLVLSRKISFGSDTYKGMENTAILSSIVQTIHRQKSTEDILPTLSSYIQAGVRYKCRNLACFVKS